MVAALMGALALGAGVSACGGSHKSTTTPSIASHTRTRPSHTTSTDSTNTTTVGTATSPAGGDTSTASSSTTTSDDTGSGSGSGSGGAGLGGGTTSTTTTTTTTSSSCTGQDCQDGSPTVPGSVPPVNGKCRSGYVYVAAQDGGPALCIPLQTTTTPATATQ
ncbi:MAG TPA: hypothetical protein VGL69_08485 [Solirubrobacteraceae bacterium]